jgi:hypothetical protein
LGHGCLLHSSVAEDGVIIIYKGGAKCTGVVNAQRIGGMVSGGKQMEYLQYLQARYNRIKEK